MHKMYLTEPECEIIEGADAIISAIGGFPSMENGELIDISIKPNKWYDVLLTFDITGWKRWTGYYRRQNEHISIGEIDPDDKVPDRIALRFEGAREVFTNLDFPGDMRETIDIYFSNTAERSKLRRASLPKYPMIVPRPYRCFYLAGRQLIIEFFECECRITATFVE